MSQTPEPGDTITIQAIQGEPSPYWVDLYAGEVLTVSGPDYSPNFTIRAESGEVKTAETGSCISYRRGA